MPTPIFFILIAAILYTVVIFTEKVKGYLKTWMIFLFFLAFTFDLIGTIQMANISINFFQNNTFLFLHNLLGGGALIVMFIHLFVAILVFKFQEYQYYFSMCSIYAWSLWMTAFVTGGMLVMI